jgi:hypothetical protein
MATAVQRPLISLLLVSSLGYHHHFEGGKRMFDLRKYKGDQIESPFIDVCVGWIVTHTPALLPPIGDTPDGAHVTHS